MLLLPEYPTAFYVLGNAYPSDNTPDDLINKTASFKYGKFANTLKYYNETNQNESVDRDHYMDNLNFTALRLEIDNQIAEWNETKRHGKSWAMSRMPKFLDTALKYLDLDRVVHEIENSLLSSVSCSACKAGVGLLQHYIEVGKTKEEIAHAAIKLCISFDIQSERVCVGVINLMVVGISHIRLVHLMHFFSIFIMASYPPLYLLSNFIMSTSLECEIPNITFFGEVGHVSQLSGPRRMQI